MQRTSNLSGISPTNYAGLVASLAVKHRQKEAQRHLMAAGYAATKALRRGLQDNNPKIRIGCCIVLDHFLDEAAVPELISNLTHEDAGVRAWALHALACDGCKQGVCRPAEAEVIPIAINMLKNDSSKKVREMAAGQLGPSVHRNKDVLDALRIANRDCG